MTIDGVLDEKYQSDNGDGQIFSQTNVAIWVLTAASGAFLFVRLWCRHRFSRLFWDDFVLTISWVCLEGDAIPGRRHGQPGL
jgi:hypothetical protein